MFVYKGTEEFDIGYGLGNHKYDFFTVNGKEDFRLLMNHYRTIFSRFDYFCERYHLSENNVDLSPAVQHKMKAHNANISLTLSKEQNVFISLIPNKEYLISTDARTRTFIVNEQTSVVTYDTYVYDCSYFSTEGIEDYIGCGMHYYYAKQYWGAIMCFNHGIKIGQETPSAFTWRGSSFMEMGYHDEAIADFTRAIELDPKKPRSFLRRGNAYRKIDCYDEAILDFTQAIELNPKKPDPFLFRGIAYREIGNLEKAKADLEKSLELRPDTLAKKILEEIVRECKRDSKWTGV